MASRPQAHFIGARFSCFTLPILPEPVVLTESLPIVSVSVAALRRTEVAVFPVVPVEGAILP